MENCGVYVIRNKVNDKAYVGSSHDIPRRWNQHLCELRKNGHDNRKLQNAWNKYGEEVWEIRPMTLCSQEVLLQREQEAIHALGAVANGYNIAPRAGRPPSPKGRKCSPEHIERVRQHKLGKKLSASHKEALRVGWIKRKEHGLGQHTEEFKVACGNRFRGSHQSVGHRRRKDEANRQAARLHNPEWRRWVGRKGAAIQNGRSFDELEPPLYA